MGNAFLEKTSTEWSHFTIIKKCPSKKLLENSPSSPFKFVHLSVEEPLAVVADSGTWVKKTNPTRPKEITFRHHTAAEVYKTNVSADKEPLPLEALWQRMTPLFKKKP